MDTTRASEPLLISGAQIDGTHSAGVLSARVGRGQLLRLRRGVYVPSEIWFRGQPWDRYRLMIAAVAVQSRDPLFCRQTALHLHRLPLLTLPAQIHIRARSRGAARTVPQPSLTGPLSPEQFWKRAVDRDDVGFSPVLFRGFGTARHLSLSEAGMVFRGLPLPVPSAGSPAQPSSEVRTEPLELALVDTVPRMAFAEAIVVLEGALRGEGGPAGAEPDRLREVAQQMIASRRKKAYLQNLLDFASALSESPGESLTRVRFHELGFRQPRQQVTVSVDGTTYRLDFVWEEAGVVVEFDGWMKYRSDFDEARKQEKIREDAIRSTGRTVLRIYWEDLMEPGCRRLHRLLTRHRIPRHAS